MQAPEWLKTAADDACITRKELCEWLNLRPKDINYLVKDKLIPYPKFVVPAADGRLGPRTRWRVGDIKKMLKSAPKQYEDF